MVAVFFYGMVIYALFHILKYFFGALTSFKILFFTVGYFLLFTFGCGFGLIINFGYKDVEYWHNFFPADWEYWMTIYLAHCDNLLEMVGVLLVLPLDIARVVLLANFRNPTIGLFVGEAVAFQGVYLHMQASLFPWIRSIQERRAEVARANRPVILHAPEPGRNDWGT